MRNPDDPAAEALRRLLDRCAREGVRCVLAAERGSRCFGTDGPGSDYDLLAIVACPPLAYAGIHPPPPTWGTEKFPEGSSVLFNVNRAVLLVARGNVFWREALHSACTLVDAGHSDGLRALSDHAFEPHSAGHQYLMRHGSAAEAIRAGDGAPRRWLQLVHPLASAVVTAATAAPPPVAFADLLDACPEPRLVEAGRAALAAKRAGAREAAPFRSPLGLDEAAGIARACRPPTGRREGPREHVSHRLREEADALVRAILGYPDRPVLEPAPGPGPVRAATAPSR